MTANVRYALRTLVGPWLLLPAIGLEVAIFLMRGVPWRGEGLWTVDWFAISLFLLGPLAAGAAAVDAARLSRPGNIHLVVSVPRPERVYLRTALWCAGPLIALHLLVIVIGILIGEVWRPSTGWMALVGAALVQCAAILWFTAIGSAIGRFSTPLLAGIAGAGAGYVLNYVVSNAFDAEPRFRLLALGGATVTQLGRVYNPDYLSGQAVVLLATALLFLVVPVTMRSGWRRPTGVGATAAAVAVVMIAVAPTVLPANRKLADAQPPTLCEGTGPQVCMYDEHRRYADLVNSRIRTLTQAALRSGYPAYVPERIVEQSQSYRASGGGVRSLWLPADIYEKGRYSIEDAAYFLIEPGHCEWMTGGLTPEGFWEVFFSLLDTWLHIAGDKLDYVPVEHRILSPEEVRTALAAFERCEVVPLT
ncbi:hypothetical protein GCM10022225_81800 [Plantactinospora mayteni]|uniref:ABC transporter permease n=1 Tax=Plantactinospora mayteni TaxID=566021 RepID=A0ABQ4ETM4_9ACTN|nr:hypothetical protein [Plantactinospora mayteni]GIG97998.1 hypothetical protein Pma05_45710 [Plantactinospora mayteni]